MGLDKHSSRLVAAPGAAGDLLDLLEAAFSRAQVASLQAQVGVDHADEREIGEVIALGHQLRADDDVRDRDRAASQVAFASDVAFDGVTGGATTLIEEQGDPWINLSDDLRFLPTGEFLWSSEKGGFRHLALHAADGRLHRPDGPAVEWPSGLSYWFWEGLHIPRRIAAKDSERARLQVLVRTPNLERRRLLLDRIG